MRGHQSSCRSSKTKMISSEKVMTKVGDHRLSLLGTVDLADTIIPAATALISTTEDGNRTL